MELKKVLQQFCKTHNLEDLHCILHITLLNCVANLSKKQKHVNISPDSIDSFSGIGKELSIQLLEELSEKSKLFKKYYIFYCPDDRTEMSFSINEDEIEDKENIEAEACSYCGKIHTYNLTLEKVYDIGYSAYKEEVVSELKLNQDDIIKEMVVINTKPENIDKLANILISRLNVNNEKQEEVKTGIIKYLYSIKKFSSVIADISSDASTITGNIKQVAEDISGLSTVKDFIK